MPAKHRVTINLDDNEYAALQAVAQKTDRSLSWLGRRAVRDLLQNHCEDLDLPHSSFHGTTVAQATS